MSEKRQIPTAAQLRPLLPVLAVVLLLLAAGLAWTGWQQMQDANRGRLLEQARDLVAQGTARSLRQQETRLQERIALPAVQAALAAGNLELAATEMRRAEWPRLESLELLSTDLDAAYAGLSEGGAGRLSAFEGALLEGAPVSRIIRDDGVRMVLAAPAKVGDQVVAIAYARLPLGIVTSALESANVAGDTYLALRQGNYTVAQRGDVGLTDSAEFLSVPVAGSDLRISAGLPEETAGVFGLAAMGSFIGAGVLVLLALAAWVLMRRGGRTVVEEGEDGPAPTLEQALAQGLATPAPTLGDATAAAPAAAAGT
ncbi:MAG: phosphomannomutase/phosphoglucomutase, partial [Pseudomonadota bacterium]|nr:phosphomannomutase/phosphoglucomutase [Pseudomonadota bacterium]